MALEHETGQDTKIETTSNNLQPAFNLDRYEQHVQHQENYDPLYRRLKHRENWTSKLLIDAKLKVSTPDDPAEKEADRVAEQIISDFPPHNPVQRKINRTPGEQTSFISLLINDEVFKQNSFEAVSAHEQDNSILRKNKADTGSDVKEDFSAKLNSLNGTGSPLPDHTRNFFENRFGHDFESVRIHTDSRSQDMANTLNARAFTTGQNVVFAKGEYSPGTTEGNRLLAHELTHVVQQSGAPGINASINPQQVSLTGKDTLQVVTLSSKIKYFYDAALECGYDDWKQARDECVLLDPKGSVVPNEEIKSWYDEKGNWTGKPIALKGYTLLSKDLSALFKKKHKVVDDNFGWLIGIAKYKYDAEQKIYFTTIEAFQQYAGYYDLYDDLSSIGPMFRIDCLKITFTSEGKYFNLRAWKGNYWSAAGGEIGIYSGEGPGKYIGADDKASRASPDNMLTMGFVLSDAEGKNIFSRYLEENWWVIGLKPYENGIWEDKRGAYTMEGVIDFKTNEIMAKDFMKALLASGFDKSKCIRQGNKVIFNWR